MGDGMGITVGGMGRGVGIGSASGRPSAIGQRGCSGSS